MPVRSLSRALTTSVAAGVLTLAVSGTALAMPATPSCECGARGTAQTSGNVTSGTDVAAPDQQNPIPAQRTPVARHAPAPHPQAPTAAPSPHVGFQWDDAGIGAGGALVVVLAGLGGTLAIRRRHVADPPLAA
ncbi:MAG: hypothetical protein QOH72_842 [Solirubrobacteraceae bacterium]|jgi:hypothetical protein|nr:hypothetical protein [Solirubrobacteraceae bacterium]